MSKCKYSWELGNLRGFKFLILRDQYFGNSMSLTNGIEDVYEELNTLKNLPVRVVYRDTEGNWDGWNPITNRFIILNASSSVDAMDKFLDKTL